MIKGWRRVILGGGLGFCLAGLGLLGGILAEPVRFDHQWTPVVNRYNALLGTWQPSRIRPERNAAAGREPSDAPWTPHLEQVKDALARENVRTARQAWHEAYGAALRSRGWEGMIAVGDASLWIGERARDRNTADARARQAYLAALLRARQQGSLDGVLRAAEAFGALGDREMAAQGLRVAENLAVRTRDAAARERVRAFAERLTAGEAGQARFP